MGPAPSETPIVSPPGPSDNSYYTAAEQSGTVQRDGVKKGCSGQVSNKSRLVSESADSRCGCVCARQVSKQVLCSQALVSGQRRDEGGYLRPKKKKLIKASADKFEQGLLEVLKDRPPQRWSHNGSFCLVWRDHRFGHKGVSAVKVNGSHGSLGQG